MAGAARSANNIFSGSTNVPGVTLGAKAIGRFCRPYIPGLIVGSAIAMSVKPYI